MDILLISPTCSNNWIVGEGRCHIQLTIYIHSLRVSRLIFSESRAFQCDYYNRGHLDKVDNSDYRKITIYNLFPRKLGPVYTALHLCAEPSWWINYGKRAASESTERLWSIPQAVLLEIIFFGDNYNVRICEMYKCIFRVFPSLPKTTFTARSCAVS